MRTTHISLVALYLRQARVHATSALVLAPGEQQFIECVLTVILSGLSLEAFANESGEVAIPEDELSDFLHSRRRFKRRSGIASSVTSRIAIVFEEKWSHPVVPGLLQRIDTLFFLRNSLVHYRLTESAAKVYLPPPVQMRTEDGAFMTVFDLEQPATRVEAPLIAKVTSTVAIDSFNTAVETLNLWNQLEGYPPSTADAYQHIESGGR